jgi:chromosome segregation protein
MADRSSTAVTISPESSMCEDPSCGAVWRKVDLHLHSPGVGSFRCPNGADVQTEAGRQKIIEAYVSQMHTAKIDIGAITDYNSIRSEWFIPIRDQARNYGITVFPGAEISFSAVRGLHVLAIFDETTDIDQVNSFLLALDRDGAKPLFTPDRKHRDIDPKDNVADTLKRLCARFGCLLIFPHPDQPNGVCKGFQPVEAAKLLKEISPDALEHCPEAEIQRLQSTGVLNSRFFERLALVEFSDPKRIEEIGTKRRADGMLRATYLKLSATNVEALRLALHDPETRLCIGEVPAAAHARVQRIVVTGSGFLGSLTIAWNDDLNVIIGGRGVGKSAIIETLRYALAMESYADQSYREELVRHALGSGGKVEVVLERPIGDGNTRRYRITRVWGEEPRVVEMESEKPVAIDPSDLLGPSGGPTILGQREIYAVSASEEYRLALLDELIGEEARTRANAVQQAIERLRTNARAILEVRARLTKRDEYQQRLKAVEHEIEVYERHGAAEKLRDATQLHSDAQQLRGATETVRKVHQEWLERSQNLLAPLETAHRSLLRGKSQQKVILEEAAQGVERLQRGLASVLEQAASLFNESESALKELSTRWQTTLRPLEEEINRIKQETQTEALDPDRLLRLAEERTALTPLIEELDRSETQLNELQEGRFVLLAEVRDCRLAEHQLRRERAEAIERLLQSRIRLEVEFKGQKQDYKDRLAALLRGSGVSQDALDQLTAPEATDGIALGEAIQSGIEETRGRFGLTPAMADRLVKWLTAEESRLFEMETLIPRDALRVELKVNGQYRSLDRLSVGQRATVILLLLFALEGRVLILDQPEDDLDNRFIYEDVVQILREQKGLKDQRKRRQIIAATHNANIPVLGDAELVLALETREGRAQVVGCTSIDDPGTRELVKAIMEGGEEAFQRRAEKYGGLRARS